MFIIYLGIGRINQFRINSIILNQLKDIHQLLLGSEINNIMINSESNLIMKTKINYLKCKAGGLHQGQILNFICIDSNCKEKGLICAVCKNINHSNHKTMHLKFFLNELDKKMNSNNVQDITTVSDQLVKLQNSKKEITGILRDTVKQIAQKVKKLEEKINQTYFMVRKAILLQSSLGRKIPNLYNLLVSSDRSPEDGIQQEVRKCSQLIEYKNDKIYFVDSCQKLVDEFSNIPSSMSVHLSTMLPVLTKLFDNLPIKISKFTFQEKKMINATQSKFSITKKPNSVILSQDFKTAEISGQETGGIVFVESEHNSSEKTKLSFKIKGCISDSISVGLGNPELVKEKGYFLDQTDNAGLFGICAMGIVLNDFQSQSFVFSEGDIIQVIWDPLQTKITFSRRNGIQKYEMFPTIDQGMISKMQFFTSIVFPGDKVQIVQ